CPTGETHSTAARSAEGGPAPRDCCKGNPVPPGGVIAEATPGDHRAQGGGPGPSDVKEPTQTCHNGTDRTFITEVPAFTGPCRGVQKGRGSPCHAACDKTAFSGPVSVGAAADKRGDQETAQYVAAADACQAGRRHAGDERAGRGRRARASGDGCRGPPCPGRCAALPAQGAGVL